MVRLLQAWRPFKRLLGRRILEAPDAVRTERLEALVMSGLDHQRCTAMRRLTPLPRALFLLHNFYGVEIGAMAEEVGADRDTIDACLADARTIVRAHVCYTEPVPGMGAAAIELEARLQQDYRRSLAVAFTESGYPGEMIWSNPAADIPTDQEAAAAFIVSQLTATLRNAVLRSRRAGVATVDQWRFVRPWRRCRRRRLLRVNDALRCAGWQPFDEWLADRLIPDHRYPHGYAEYRRRRRPLPEERPLTEAEQNGEEIADIVQIPEPLTRQSELTRHVWIFFYHYGRSTEEIVRRLGISRASVKRRREQADYAIIGMDYPSLAFRIRFAIMVRRLGLGIWWDRIRSALYG